MFAVWAAYNRDKVPDLGSGRRGDLVKPALSGAKEASRPLQRTPAKAGKLCDGQAFKRTLNFHLISLAS
jgi:hypothetical protein